MDKFYTDVAHLSLPPNFIQPPRELVTILAYVDDVVISSDPALSDYIWPLWISTLANHGLQVEPSKCKAWIPADAQKNLNIDTHVPVVLGGLPVLGTAAQSEHSCLTTLPSSNVPTTNLLADAHKRLQSAQQDADLLQQMAQTNTDVLVRYAAWPNQIPGLQT